MSYKKKILFIGEASFLETGFSTYYESLLPRLHATDKYEIFEYGSYGNANDERAKNILWKFYGVLPESEGEQKAYGNPQGTLEEQNRYRTNQFGEYKLSKVLLDCQPDIICSLRDNWMDEYVLRNQFRDNFHFVWMPTVDGAPQAERWLADYRKVDTVLTYSEWGKKILEGETKKEIQVVDVLSPGVDLKTFVPMDREKVMDKWGLNKRLNIIGTVMRNQSRKLFPRLIQSYKLFKRDNPIMAKRTALWLHTSYPDVGFDFPVEIWRQGLQNDVIFTYVCHTCSHVFVAPFLSWDLWDKKDTPEWNPKGICSKCGKREALMPNTQKGVSRQQLAEIYNMFSVCVQASICEGFGMPIPEAKACGTPVLAVDYSAMSEQCRNGGAQPIKVQTMYTESQTMCYRALFDRQDLADKCAYLMADVNKEEYDLICKDGRDCVEKLYNWDIQAKKWEKLLDNIEIKDRSTTWDMPPSFMPFCKTQPSSGMTPEDFVAWCYEYLHGNKDEPHDSSGFKNWLNECAKGTEPIAIVNFFRRAALQHNLAEEKRTGVTCPERAEEQDVNALRGILV